MNTVPKRPTRESVMLKAINKCIAENAHQPLPCDAETIADCIDTYCGFEMMLELQREGYDFVRDDLDTLDAIARAIYDAHREAEEKWAIENDVYNKAFPVGTRLSDGVIVSISFDRPMIAYYVLDTPGHRPNSQLITRFEDAVLA